MAASLSDLIAQREALDRQIAEQRKRAKSDAIAQVRVLMAEHGLTAADLAVKPAAQKTGQGQRAKVAAKYRNAATGDTWSGRGLKPKWLAAALSEGKTLDHFAI